MEKIYENKATVIVDGSTMLVIDTLENFNDKYATDAKEELLIENIQYIIYKELKEELCEDCKLGVVTHNFTNKLVEADGNFNCSTNYESFTELVTEIMGEDFVEKMLQTFVDIK